MRRNLKLLKEQIQEHEAILQGLRNGIYDDDMLKHHPGMSDYNKKSQQAYSEDLQSQVDLIETDLGADSVVPELQGIVVLL